MQGGDVDWAAFISRLALACAAAPASGAGGEASCKADLFPPREALSGRRLLERALQIAREGRAQLCSLNVDTSNEPALTLYRGVGFRVASTRRDYYCVGRDAYAMEVSLAEQ